AASLQVRRRPFWTPSDVRPARGRSIKEGLYLETLGTVDTIVLDNQPMGEDGVVADLVQLGQQELQTWGERDGYRFAAHVHFDSGVPHVRERAELVDREGVLHPVTQLLGEVPCVVCERLGRVSRLPPRSSCLGVPAAGPSGRA